MRVIVHEETHGILGPIVGITPIPQDMLESAAIKYTFREFKNKPPYAVMDSGALPSLVFRSEWKLIAGKVGIDLPKAKEKAHEIRREKRKEYFSPRLDVVDKNAKGIPLGAGENLVSAKQEMTDYKTNTDDLSQLAIDAATNEAELLIEIKRIT